MLINFITNIPLQEISGGFSGMNAAACESLTEIADVHYVGPVNPPVNRFDWVVSKMKRSAGLPGNFFFFSEQRLNLIAAEVDRQCDPSADCDFYHGFTPWIRCISPRPYFAWSDCCFRDYIDIYHPPGLFEESDVRTICSDETTWMRGAQAVLFSSEWARLRTEMHYGLDKELLGNVSIFGAVEIPGVDSYKGGHDFLFISTDYQRKNGSICRRAMELVWEKYPESRLIIIGAPPPPEELTDERVQYLGYLKKSVPEQQVLFTHHLSRAFALLHPTNADTTAMVVIEAGFYGCPSITMDSFAIPEVTGNGEYAVLLSSPPGVHRLAKAMIEFLQDQERYMLLRTKARAFSISKFSRASFKRRLQAAILSRFSAAKTCECACNS
jgi:glycosyltransferase involved in cell wall biosynthesis